MIYNLLEILHQAQGGAAMDNIARQFGLSPDETRRAAEAFLPALTLGFQRNALMDPMGFATLFWRAAQPPGASLFDTPGRAFSIAGQEQGDLFLRQLFGSQQAGPRIAQQASAATGIGNEVMRQMLPVMAGMVVTGMMHAAMNQGGGDVLSRLGALMGPTAPPPPSPKPVPLPLPLQAVAPWAAFMNAFLSEPKPAEPARRPSVDPLPPSPDLIGQMFQAGVQAQEQYLAAIRNLLDSFWGAPGPPSGSGSRPT